LSWRLLRDSLGEMILAAVTHVDADCLSLVTDASLRDEN